MKSELTSVSLNVKKPTIIKSNQNTLKKEDIQYISSKTGLSTPKTILITEERIDLDLILNEISKKSLIKDELTPLSPIVATKLIIYSNSQDLDINIEEKSYVASFLHNYFKLAQKTKAIAHTKQILANESNSQYFLTLIGLFKDKMLELNPQNSINGILEFVAQGFRQCEKREVANHTYIWHKVLLKVSSEGWFSKDS